MRYIRIVGDTGLFVTLAFRDKAFTENIIIAIKCVSSSLVIIVQKDYKSGVIYKGRKTNPSFSSTSFVCKT